MVFILSAALSLAYAAFTDGPNAPPTHKSTVAFGIATLSMGVGWWFFGLSATITGDARHWLVFTVVTAFTVGYSTWKKPWKRSAE